MLRIKMLLVVIGSKCPLAAYNFIRLGVFVDFFRVKFFTAVKDTELTMNRDNGFSVWVTFHDLEAKLCNVSLIEGHIMLCWRH